VKVEPPFEVVGIMDGELEEETEKSETRAVVAPETPETEMVHEIAPPSRSGLAAEQSKDDCVVGFPYTRRDWEPPMMLLLPTCA